MLKMSQISIKIGVNFDKSENLEIKKSELLSSEYDMPESHIKFEITGNTAAKMINSAAGIAKKLFLDTIIDKIKENFDEILKSNLEEMIKNVGKDIDLSEPLKFSSKNEDILLSVPKLMALGILYCLSNSKLRAEKFYELIQSEMEDTIDTYNPEF